jgi:hypothetical protein
MELSRFLVFNRRAGSQVGKTVDLFAHRLLIQDLARLFRVALKAIQHLTAFTTPHYYQQFPNFF